MFTKQEQLHLIGFINENAYGMTSNILNESAQSTVTNAVLDKMFELTVGKYNKIDFSDIEKSRGDITKTKFYKNLNEAIESLMDIHATTNSIPGILTVSTALNNLKTLKNTFEYNFRLKNNSAIMIYNTIYYAIMEATSMIIASSISISKDGNVDVYTLSNKDYVLLSSLEKFNLLVDDGSIMKFMQKSHEEMTNVQNEAIELITQPSIFSFLNNGKVKDIAKKAVLITAASGIILYLGTHIIPLIREIIYWIYKAKHKISEAAQLQAEYLNLSITNLKSGDGNEKIIARQMKYVKLFESISRKFSLDSDKADRDSKMDIKNDKIDVSNVII